jgi:hypothetical protein
MQRWQAMAAAGLRFLFSGLDLEAAAITCGGGRGYGGGGS